MKRCIFICLVIVLIPLIKASALGVSPTIFKLNFQPNLEQTFELKVFESNPEQIIKLSVKGDLAEYVNLSINELKGGGGFSATIKLPSNIEKPGKHRTLLIVTETGTGEQGEIVGFVSIQIPIDVFVPYPGKYIEASFSINNINEGENAEYQLIINNLGTEDVNIESRIELFQNKEVIITKNLGQQFIKTKESATIKQNLETSSLKLGIYPVNVSLIYEKPFSINTSLKVGAFYVNITDYSYKFKAGKINPFYLEIENLWNSGLNNVYGNVVVNDGEKTISEFKTPSIQLSPWERTNLTGFFNTENIKKGKYTASLNVYYGGERTNKLVAFYVVGGINLLIVGIIVVVVLIGIMIYLVIKIRSLKKYARKKSKYK